MNRLTLMKRNLRFYRRSHWGTFLGAMVAAAVLIGALAIGDSVKYSLKQGHVYRLGRVELSMNGQSRYFRAELSEQMAQELQVPTAGIIHSRGILQKTDGSGQSISAGVLGVDESFWGLSPTGHIPLWPSENEDKETVLINSVAAERMNLQTGQEIRLQLEKPDVLSREAPLTLAEPELIRVGGVVGQIVERADFGWFGLHANQIPPATVYVARSWLGEKMGRRGRANLLLTGQRVSVEQAEKALQDVWQLEDTGLRLESLLGSGGGGQSVYELRSDRIFLEEAVVQAARKTPWESTGVLSYFANEISSGENRTPYSFVTAVEKSEYSRGLIPEDMGKDEIVIHQWLAEDLDVHVGEKIKLRYYVVGDYRSFREESRGFVVRRIIAMDDPAVNKTWMPPFEGLVDIENCRDWRPGIPIELGRIREKDEAYWQRYGGAPKAFVTLEAGQEMWGNRFGRYTGIRFCVSEEEKLSESILANLSPGQMGLFFEAAAAESQRASEQAMDFGWLFLGLTFFLLISALLLTGLLFSLNIEQRRSEVGTLLAIGFTAGRIRRLLLWEGLILAGAACVAGIPFGLVYGRIMLEALGGVWRGAVGSAMIDFHVRGSRLIIGAMAGFLMAWVSQVVVLRSQCRESVRELFDASSARNTPLRPERKKKFQKEEILFSFLCCFAGLCLSVKGWFQSPLSPGFFFGAGVLLLTGSISLIHVFWGGLSRGQGNDEPLGSLLSLARRNTFRRKGRNMSMIVLLACSLFLLTTVAVNRRDPASGSEQRQSGTGGFRLMAELVFPLYTDVRIPSFHEQLGLDGLNSELICFVPVRVRNGQNADCRNLNRSQIPDILGIEPGEFADRNAFRFKQVLSKEAKTAEEIWRLLDRDWGDGVIPAVADHATIQWALGKKVGDTLSVTDDSGKTVEIQLIGSLDNSILQGALILSEKAFLSHFPSQSGCRKILIDCDEEVMDPVRASLWRGLGKYGIVITTTRDRLVSLYAVESTYLSIFQVLGGLGLVLGVLGVGLLVTRNLLERRSELALLMAVGYTRGRLYQLIRYETIVPFLLAVVCGAGSVFIVTIPLWFGHSVFTVISVSIILFSVVIVGMIAIIAATKLALKGSLLRSLRNE